MSGYGKKHNIGGGKLRTPRRHCKQCGTRTRYEHIHVRSGSRMAAPTIHGLTRSWNRIVYSTSSHRFYTGSIEAQAKKN